VKLDPANSGKQIVVGGGIATTTISGAKSAPQAGLVNSEVLPAAVGKRLTAEKSKSKVRK
jgi:hypothetical protein